MGTQTVKLTISVPRELAKLADKVAKERKISRSKVVSSCLQELAKQRLQAELEEGYRAMAKDSTREKEAIEWAEATFQDVNDEKG
jgi:metal-responsive CopG/Arc/MetJ family transcriptional regulator